MPQAGGFRGCAGCRRSEASRLRVLGKWSTAAFSGTRRGRPSSPFPPSSLVLSLGAASLWGQLLAPGGVSPEAGLATRPRQLGSSARTFAPCTAPRWLGPQGAGWVVALAPPLFRSASRVSSQPGRVGVQLRTAPPSDCQGWAGGPAGRGVSGGTQ